MRYKLLGRSGLRVSELCLGAMTFDGESGWGADKSESQKVFETFTNQGGNFIDTANFYTKGRSEKLLGEFVAAERDRFVIATKYSLTEDPEDPNAGGNHRKNMMRSIEGSLKRLNTEYIDLFWLHIWDFLTPMDEVLRGLDDLVRSGKVHYLGISDTPAWVVSSANTLAELRGWNSFAALQIQYSLLERTPERELLPMAKDFNLSITPWGALGFGMLTGKYANEASGAKNRLGEESVWRDHFVTERNLLIAQTVAEVASELGRTSSQVALAWVKSQSENIIPIVGARTQVQLSDNLECLNLKLSNDQLEKLNKVSKIELGFPHDFLKQENIQEAVFGETLQKISPRN